MITATNIYGMLYLISLRDKFQRRKDEKKY